MDKTVVKISSELEMLGFIKTNGTQCRFVSMVTETPVKDVRAACPFKDVIKISKKTGMINVNYASKVSRMIAEKLGLNDADVNYIPKASWHEHLLTSDGKPLPVVRNRNHPDNGKHYLLYYPRTSENVYRLPNGEPVQENELKPYFYAKSSLSEFKPPVITIDLANIKELRASGIIMQAEDIDEAKAALANG